MRIGILGGGQLGRMLALAATPLNWRIRVFDPAADAPADVIAEHIRAEFDDPVALARFARDLDVITYEFENVPADAVERLAQGGAKILPPPIALVVGHDRLAEKNLFGELGVETARFASVERESELPNAVAAVGLPAILKTRRMGYDGKGQTVLRSPDEVANAWSMVSGQPSVLEAFVSFDRELSILAVRGRDGQCLYYPLVENYHDGGILRQTIAPAPNVSAELESVARELARRVLERLDYVGVLAIELFEVNGRLLANELAPRVHNSGHWTIEGAQTSQFENHLRAVAGVPLGSTQLVAPCVMLNLVGAIPPIAEILAIPSAHLHLYDKEPRAGRKVGHVTIRREVGVDLADSSVRLTKLLADGIG